MFSMPYLLMFSMPPPGSFDHHTRGKLALAGFFKLLQHTVRIVLECALDAGASSPRCAA